MEKRVVITGIGPISSIGIGKDIFWNNILQEKTNVKEEECSLDGELWDKYHVHRVDGFDIHKFGIDENKLHDIEEWKEGEHIRDLDYLIASVKLALDDSSLEYNTDKNDLGLVLAHENLGLMPFALKVSDITFKLLAGKTKQEITKKEFYERFYKSFMKSCYDVQTFANLYHVARTFNIHNYSLFINNACASGLYAIEAASQIIKNKQAKAVVVAASDFPDIYKYIWFKNLGIYSPDGKMRPFSKQCNGLVFGDGGAALVMEEMGHAVKRNAPIYAEYVSGGFDLEGWKITVPQIGSTSYQNAMRKALVKGKVEKEEIELVCPHGVSSRAIDYYESKAITEVFGSNHKKPLITALKPYVGHNLGSSALLETAILLLSMKNNVVPPTLNTKDIDPIHKLSLVKSKIETKISTAMKVTCAFAGYNAATIFRKV